MSYKQEHGFTDLYGTNTKMSHEIDTESADKKAEVKEEIRQFLLTGMSLAPHKFSGFNVCASAGFCAKVCVLWFAGRTVMDSVRDAAIARTKLFFTKQLDFFNVLRAETTKFRNKAIKKGYIPTIRLNVASDLPWERIVPWLFTEFNDVLFYDYTKITRRFELYTEGKLPENYELTYSYNELSDDSQVSTWLDKGFNVAMVFDTPYRSLTKCDPLPTEWNVNGKTYTVVDGDAKGDIRTRELDGHGVIVGLHAKGGRRSTLEAVEAGFVQSVPSGVHERFILDPNVKPLYRKRRKAELIAN